MVHDNGDRWRQIKAIFEEALKKDAAERQEFLDEACEGDEELIQEVWSLLANHEAEGPVDELLNTVMASFHSRAARQELKGWEIGPYKLVERLGEGGMGQVWLARRADGQFEQEVALKLLAMGVASDEGIRRFLAERQILATLTHPNIARLLDGGITEDGQPYFVMEVVAGQRVDEYCDKHQLSIEERLKLFLDVCHAVQYAHQKLVIHRDLKPSNVLVNDDRTVKLLDFGIAKLIEPGALSSEEALYTRTGMTPMTPEYASPEQVLGGEITTVSDVYQLGILLYELLTGVRPYRVVGRTPSEVERVICEDEPPRPSTVVTGHKDSGDGSPEEVAQQRQTHPAELQKNLAGDLDTIVMMALRKEPDRRYDSVQQLADDVQRCLDGHAVSAHPNTWRYRTQKFVNRHRWGVAVTVLLMLIMISYGATVTWHSQQTQQALERAEVEALKSERVTDFMISLFDQANPYGTTEPAVFGDTLTAQELIDQGAARIQEELDDQPDVQAKMLYNLGRINRQLGRYSEAESLLNMAIAQQRKHPATHRSDLAESLHELARIYRHKGELERPEELYQEALSIQRAQFGEAHPDIAENLNELGIIGARSGDFPRADTLFRKALAMNESLLGSDHPDVANSRMLLGLLYLIRDELSEADALFRQALSVFQSHYGPDHPTVAASKNRLGQVLLRQGAVEEAAPLIEDALRIRKAIFSGDHPDLAVSFNNTALLNQKREQYATADSLYQQSQEMYQRMYGSENLDAATTLFRRAQMHEIKGDYPAAESFYKRAASMQESLHGLDNWYTRDFLHGLASLYTRWGKTAKADSLQRLIVER